MLQKWEIVYILLAFLRLQHANSIPVILITPLDWAFNIKMIKMIKMRA